MKPERESCLRRKIDRLMKWVGELEEPVEKPKRYLARPVRVTQQAHESRKASTVEKVA